MMKDYAKYLENKQIWQKRLDNFYQRTSDVTLGFLILLCLIVLITN